MKGYKFWMRRFSWSIMLISEVAELVELKVINIRNENLTQLNRDCLKQDYVNCLANAFIN
jgi:hypothetical protein